MALILPDKLTIHSELLLRMIEQSGLPENDVLEHILSTASVFLGEIKAATKNGSKGYGPNLLRKKKYTYPKTKIEYVINWQIYDREVRCQVSPPRTYLKLNDLEIKKIAESAADKVLLGDPK